LKVSLYIGVALATPVWLWETWRFIPPGLEKNEKRYAVPFVLSACVLWRKWRRPAIVVLCGVAAVATPCNDPFSFVRLAVPMLLLDELSIVVGRLLNK
jgi:Sec-independent protein secretion pathway component TatC